MPPNISNGMGGSSNVIAHHRKKRYFKMLDERQNCGLIPAPPKQPFVRSVAYATMYLGARMDSENAKYRAYKWPMDWLKTRGYIVDDRGVSMRDPEQHVRRGQEYTVHITLTKQPRDRE